MNINTSFDSLQGMITDSWRRGRRVGMREGMALGFVLGCLAGWWLR